MIEDLKNRIKGKDHYYLIGIYTHQDKTYYEFLEVALEIDELKIIKKGRFSDIETASKDLFKKNYPVLLHFDGDNVISRVTENKKGYRNSIVFKMNPDDFYFYEYFQEQQVFASLSRKQFIDDTIQLFNASDKYVVHVSIGPFVNAQLHPILKNTNQVFSGFHELKFDDNGIESFEKTEQKDHEIDISDETFNQREIGLVATFLNYKQGNQKIEFDDTFLQKNREEQKFRKRFKQMSAFTITLIMLLLFAGHLLLNYYVESLGEKESRYSISQQTLMELTSLQEERQLKEKILETSGVIDANYMTQYFAEIGNVVPESITITSIEVASPLKKIKPNEKIVLNTKTIDVSGTSYNDDDFNTLIKNIRSISWVTKVEINSFTEDRSGNTFLIKVKK